MYNLGNCEWSREPFFGGCHYRSDRAIVTGLYRPADPLEFEDDCHAWFVDVLPGHVFKTADAAMAAVG